MNKYEEMFNADEYFPPDGSETGGETSSTAESGSSDDGIAPRYLPPHKRPVQLEMGEHIVMYTGNDDPDKIQGAQGDKVKRLLVYVNFALVASAIKALHSRFPMMHFHSKGFFNHDHPISHVITQMGTRQLQRMFPAGARILDVYGNQNACDSFNASQRRGNNPKFMRALVTNWGGSDFLREITKWGPHRDTEGNERYIKNTIRRQYDADSFDGFNCFQLVHTLYYLSRDDVLRMVHAAKGNMVCALVHTHPDQSGQINEGEQRYVKSNGAVRQWNVKTNTRYTHYDLAPFYFREVKTHWGDGEFQGRGMQWECHFVCENTWIIQIVAASQDDVEDEDQVDFDAMFDGVSKSESAAAAEAGVMAGDFLPTENIVEFIQLPDGTTVPLLLSSPKLLKELKAYAMGKERNPKLFHELIKHAKHLTRKSHLFPDQEVIVVDEKHIIDHIASAYCNNGHEQTIVGAVASLKDAMSVYNNNLSGGSRFNNATLNAMIEGMRGVIGAAVTINKIHKSPDKIGRSLAALDQALNNQG